MEAVSDGLRIHFEIHGTGAPVVLLHGYPLSGSLWEGVVERLGGTFRLIVPDLRGHGRSEAAESASMAQMAADVRAVLEAADEERPVALVGMSMGGYVALAYCRSFPGAVRGLALIASRAAGDSAEQAEVRRRSAVSVLRDGPGEVVAGMMEKLWGPDAPAGLTEPWRQRMAATDPRGIAAALRGMADRPDARDLLGGMGIPFLVVAGEEDRIVPLEEARAMAQGANGTLVVVPGAGHMVPVEEPDAVTEALRRWLPTLP